ncbi:hypothetical protein KSP40_PGU009409 [Platanthera guangdongensis]|uniref:Uncharacterized protein n=1 Tax=Platanthera guangdongensis TaxID=2320717 RepID=A0ABR2LF48_9ASPA
MGNCIEGCGWISTAGEKEVEVMEIKQGVVKGDNEVKNSIRLILTKSEVEWLMQQVGEKQGGRRLQDLLQELADRGGEEDSRWKPVLDSIMEVPEVLSFSSSSADHQSTGAAVAEGAPSLN